MKTLKAAGTLALLVLAFPAAALAHTGSAIVSCTAADYHFSHFLAGANTVHYTVVADNVAVAHGDFTLNQAGGTAGALHVPLALSGTHTVSSYAWWGPAGTVKRQTGGSYAVPLPDPLPMDDARKSVAGELAILMRIIRQSDGTSFYVDHGGVRHWIPDGATYMCLRNKGKHVLAVTKDQVAAVSEGSWQSCR